LSWPLPFLFSPSSDCVRFFRLLGWKGLCPNSQFQSFSPLVFFPAPSALFYLFSFFLSPLFVLSSNTSNKGTPPSFHTAHPFSPPFSFFFCLTRRILMRFLGVGCPARYFYWGCDRSHLLRVLLCYSCSLCYLTVPIFAPRPELEVEAVIG